MDLTNKWYMPICISISIFLFGFALYLNYFTGNLFILTITLLICSVLSLIAIYFVGVLEEIEPIEFTKKAVLIGSLVFLTTFIFIFALLLEYFPDDLVAYLIGIGVGNIIALIIMFFLMQLITPLKQTSKAEFVVAIIILIFGFLIIQSWFLDNLVAILIVAGICLLLYLFAFLFVQFY